ncbi:ATP-binding protein [Epilithonimonas ginsengisoli]|uniref:ATP-binding protein n=1 Tax=Epilithonimonas ginsengisoli TaxID=1245592 RepID=A0ABU4JGW4_9FLAO|nr:MULTISPECIES: ATP-binding protein [Chryseobacterium group]MBV6878802.1 ATP-binding protein [Epilithonimonas sp. FP105]MDW8548867.1 ATP-binding protein [Epilithonimonas ginsengisoli]OAH72358.1 ATPase [Chryseobacterium sp. FP211-J200]
MSNSRLIPTEKIIERLQYENPWWITQEIPTVYKEMSKRLYFELFYPFVKEKEIRRAVVLMGPRRVGKTVMMFHTIDQLIAEKINPQRIFFVPIDNPIYVHLSLQEILDLCKEALKISNLEDCYVFFDEIQYLKDWERHLKVLVDSYPNTKFIVSGSAAAALKWHSTESGAGRFTDFMLPPLTFQEFIHLKNKNHLVKNGFIEYGEKQLPYFIPHDIDELNKEFLQYLNFGGYPEVVLSEKIQKDMGRYVKNDIVDKVLLRDLPSLYGIKDVQELNRFFTYIAYNTGNEFSYETMSRESGIQKETLKKYLEYLDAAFLIKVLNKVDVNAKRFKRITSFKVYLTNPSLRTALFSPVKETDSEMGNMVETAVLSQWMHRENLDLTYARWKDGRVEGEVDLVLVDDKKFKPVWGVEIKWSNRFYEMPQDLSSLIQFCKANQLNSALVTTIARIGTKKVSDLNFTFVPACVYAYNIGENTLRMKSTN